VKATWTTISPWWTRVGTARNKTAPTKRWARCGFPFVAAAATAAAAAAAAVAAAAAIGWPAWRPTPIKSQSVDQSSANSVRRLRRPQTRSGHSPPPPGGPAGVPALRNPADRNQSADGSDRRRWHTRERGAEGEKEKKKEKEKEKERQRGGARNSTNRMCSPSFEWQWKSDTSTPHRLIKAAVGGDSYWRRSVTVDWLATAWTNRITPM